MRFGSGSGNGVIGGTVLNLHDSVTNSGFLMVLEMGTLGGGASQQRAQRAVPNCSLFSIAAMQCNVREDNWAEPPGAPPGEPPGAPPGGGAAWRAGGSCGYAIGSAIVHSLCYSRISFGAEWDCGPLLVVVVID